MSWLDRLQDAVSAGRLPGAVAALVDSRGVRHLEAFGDYRPDNVFFMASCAKAIAATVISVLADEGLFTLDEPAARWFPALDPAVTLRRLLSHTAGVFANDTKDPAQIELLRNYRRPLAEAATGIALQPLAYQPGEGVAYSDAGMFLAGRIAELATGHEFDQTAREHLFVPLGMSETFYRRPPESVGEERYARAWHRTPRGLQVAGKQHRPHAGGLVRVGSGVFSTPADLALFLRFHLAEPRPEMRRDQTGGRWRRDPMGGVNAGYGLGFQLGAAESGGLAREFFHAGAFGTLLWADDRRGLGVILLTQMPIMHVYGFWRELIAEIRESE